MANLIYSTSVSLLQTAEGELTKKEQGIEWPEGGVGHPLGVGSGDFFEFSSKKCRVLCIFSTKNYACGQKLTGTGQLNQPPTRA